jgi:hypothetical protein
LQITIAMTDVILANRLTRISTTGLQAAGQGSARNTASSLSAESKRCVKATQPMRGSAIPRSGARRSSKDATTRTDPLDAIHAFLEAGGVPAFAPPRP